MPRHFAERAAEEVAKRFPGEKLYIVEAGVTPSGKIHLGNFIDMVVADAVLKVLRKKGVDVKGYLAVDSMDPFRQPPSFAPESFKREAEAYAGQPFEAIPDPWGCHSNYAEHFVKPAEESFPHYNVELEVLWASSLHKREEYVKSLLSILSRSREVVNILNRVKRAAGHSKLYPDWWIPYRPRCAECGRIDENVRPEAVSGSRVRYTCSACGHKGEADVAKGEGKPPWRIDWPLRWLALNIHFEPLGKDHMASGSGYDTGCALIREFLNREPPVPVFYDFIYWVEHHVDGKRLQKFSKRKGTGLGVDEWLKYAPAEVLRFQLLKREVDDIFREALSHWEFDFLQIPNYVEEFDKFESTALTSNDEVLKLVYELSIASPIPSKVPKKVSYPQLVRVAAWMENVEDGLQMLRRQGKLEGMEDWEVEGVKRRLILAKNWLEVAGYKVVLRNPTEAVEDFKKLEPQVQRAFLEAAKLIVGGVDPVEAVKKSSESQGLSGKEARLQVYRAFYLLLLGEESGPPLRRLVVRDETRQCLIKLLKILFS
ncbi:MAG: lysine--tRNA ligase [Thermofilaceae archaeon]|nr:lysine--tRNA ligase [Thermofilaceae archaeon]MCX8179829.1 lysine--tRNA ligase [Thermofilaceae archaeon]MDW8004355.1 lysine--tRNA ligase [Thermofilaceae archaeon]